MPDKNDVLAPHPQFTRSKEWTPHVEDESIVRGERKRGQRNERPDERLIANPDVWVSHKEELRGDEPEAQDQTQQEPENDRRAECRGDNSEAKPDRPSWYGVLTLREIAIDNIVLRPALLSLFLGLVLNAFFRVSWYWTVSATLAVFAFQAYHGSRYVREERARLAAYKARLAGQDAAAKIDDP